MAKEIEKKSARILFIEQGKSSEEIAGQLGVNKRTVDRWATEGEWRKIRDAKANSGKERIDFFAHLCTTNDASRIGCTDSQVV